MLQNLTIVSIALILGIAMSGCGRQETTTPTTTDQPPAADIPVFVPSEDGQ